MQKRQLITAAVLAVIFLVAGTAYLGRQDGASGSEFEQPLPTMEVLPLSSEAESPAEPVTTAERIIFVHIGGEVISPGVYEAPAGVRGYELIEMAGGFTEAAARDYLNLARVVQDGEKLVIPDRSTPVLPEGEASGAEGQKALVNINLAGEEELKTLPGIGAAKAQAIIAYREENGGFKQIEDIMQIPGIKDAAFEKLKGSITVN